MHENKYNSISVFVRTIPINYGIFSMKFYPFFGHKTTESGYGFGLAGSRSET